MNAVAELLETIGMGLVLLLPLTNPLTTIVLMLSLSGNQSRQELNRQAYQTSLYVFLIMMGAYYIGQLVMSTFGISIPGLRIAGGLIVAFLGFRMLFPQSAEQQPSSRNQGNKSVAFIPLAMPCTAGPGTIAMIISTAATVKSGVTVSPLTLMLAPVLIFFLISLILWICLRSASAIVRLLGYGGIDAIARFMGFLLICMGVQFIINGIMEIVKSFS